MTLPAQYGFASTEKLFAELRTRNRGRGKYVRPTDAERKKIPQLLQAGRTGASIAQVTGVSRATIIEHQGATRPGQVAPEVTHRQPADIIRPRTPAGNRPR